MRHFYPILRFAFVCVFAFIFNPVHAQVILTAAGSGNTGYTNGPATAAQMNSPMAVAVDKAGNIYFADYNNNVIRKISGGIVSTIAGTGTAGYNGDNGKADTSLLNGPEGVAVDTAGNIYIADFNNARVRMVTKATGLISTIA
ncbi:MAG TPA: hypothetical protein VK890_09635, partial [Bacteroidia bacterium]|nr:hypothetical protein [Bacteroidia bacterium]